MPTGIVQTYWNAVRDQCGDLGLTFDRWQDGSGRLILAQRSGGKYAAGIGGVHLSWPRQVGKTYLIGAIIIAMCLLRPGLLALWTAHHGKTINETFRAMQAMTKRSRIAPHVLRVTTGNGDEGIEFRNGSRILFGAREHGFGLGFSKVSLIVFDEAQRLKARTIVDMVPTTNAAANPLVFYIGTPPRPDDAGDVFIARRKKALAVEAARAAGEDPRYNALYIELGADPTASRDAIDWEQLAKANPSYPHRVDREAIERMWEQFEDKDDFRREGYGIWDATDAWSVIPSAKWADCEDESSQIVGDPVFALDVAPGRGWSAIGVAGAREDGLPHVEITQRQGLSDHRPGTDWIVPRLVELRDAFPGMRLVVASASAAESLVPALTSEGFEPEFVKGNDVAAACGLFYDYATTGGLRHVGQVGLTLALATARKNIEDGEGAWRWGRKRSAADITPLYAVTLALWAWRGADFDYDIGLSIL